MQQDGIVPLGSVMIYEDTNSYPILHQKVTRSDGSVDKTAKCYGLIFGTTDGLNNKMDPAKTQCGAIALGKKIFFRKENGPRVIL